MDEARELEVAVVHPQNKSCVHRVQRVRVVADVGAVGGTYLYQLGSALAHHVRDAEAAPDLHQLAPADKHLPLLGQCGQG